MVPVRPWFALALVLLGVLGSALPFVPAASAECHCSLVGCMEYAVADSEDEEKDLNSNGKVDLEEMDTCTVRAKVTAAVAHLALDVTMTAYVGAESMSVDSAGEVSVTRGSAGLIAVKFTGGSGNQTPAGMMRFGAVPGVTFPHGQDAAFEVGGDDTADVEFLVAEDAPDDIAIPYTVTRAGQAPHEGRIELHAADAAATGGMSPEEVGVLGGIVGLVLGALLAAVVMMVFRK